MAALGLTRLVVYGWVVLCGLAWGLPGCSEPPIAEGFERVTIAGESFDLELAVNSETRVQGLSGRESIPENGGMLFVFPRAARQSFVMRDCLVPIDIAFLDGTGRVVAAHAMEVEEPRKADESQMAYELRLRKYSSRFGALYASELAGGRLAELGIEAGDVIELDHQKLKAIVR